MIDESELLRHGEFLGIVSTKERCKEIIRLVMREGTISYPIYLKICDAIEGIKS